MHACLSIQSTVSIGLESQAAYKLCHLMLMRKCFAWKLHIVPQRNASKTLVLVVS